MTRTRWLDVAAIALTIVVLAGLGFALRPQHTPTVPVAPAAAHVDRPQLSSDTRSSVLFIGDSYTWGSGLAENSYGCMAAVRLGWLCHVSGGPGTGYISGGVANRFVLNDIGPSSSFDERIPRLAAIYDPDFVVLDGGRNDLFAPSDAVFDAMSDTIAAVHQAWPNARIVFIRPRLLARPNDDLGFDDDFIDRLREESATQNLVVVDPINTFTSTDTSAMLSSDGIHPNHRGVLALSSALLDALRDNGFASEA